MSWHFTLHFALGLTYLSGVPKPEGGKFSDCPDVMLLVLVFELITRSSDMDGNTIPTAIPLMFSQFSTQFNAANADTVTRNRKLAPKREISTSRIAEI